MKRLILSTAFALFATLALAQTFPELYVGQIKIAVTNTAVCLPYVYAQTGVIVKAKSANAGNGFVGGSAVTTTDDGTGNGYRLLPGEAWSGAVSGTSTICVNGTANDVYYYSGN